MTDDQGGAKRQAAWPAEMALPPPPGAWQRYQVLTVCAFLLLAVGLVFAQTVRHEFVNLDDHKYVYKNPLICDGLSIPKIAEAFTRSHAANWVPLTWLSLMGDYELYGLNAGGYHLTNVLLHAATTVLLFLLLTQMTGRVWPSALAAALFAVHPLRVESVAWVTERKDVLSGLFFVLALGAYVGYVRHRPSLVRYLAVMVLLALGLMSKAMLVTLPLVLLLLDYWPLGRFAASPGRRATPPHGNEGALAGRANSWESVLGWFPSPWHLVIEKVPLLVLVAGSCLVTVCVQGEALAANEFVPLNWRLGNAPISYAIYLGQFLYPAGLAPLYPPPGLDAPLWRVLQAVLILLGITVTTLVTRRKHPYLLVGWLWFLGMLLPVIGLVRVGLTVRGADRFTYLPQIGLCIALAWAAADACRSSPRRRWVCGIASALALAVLMGCAWRQTSFWRRSETLWLHTLACTVRNSVAHNSLGIAFANQGRLDEAIVQYQAAVESNPKFTEAYYDLGIALADLGRFEEAAANYQKALQLQPNHAMAHNDLAWLRASCPEASIRNGAKAVAHAQQANRLCGGKQPGVLDTLAAAYAEAGRFPEALATARKALELATQENDLALADILRAGSRCMKRASPIVSRVRRCMSRKRTSRLAAPALLPPKP